MRRIFTKFPLGFGISFQAMLPLGARQLIVRCGLALVTMAASVHAQKIQTPPPNGRKIHSIARTTRADSEPTPTTHEPMSDQPPLLPPFTPEQTAPNPPRVSYEGGKLTIVAEDSELSDVLSQLKACTGADIDFPPSAAHQRIWAGLGPGPARKLLASLLSGTGLDYAIQGSDIDPQGIGSIILTVRTHSDIEKAGGQENQGSQEPEASSQLPPEDLRPASAELPPTTETPESAANEPPASPEVPPAEVQPSLEADYGVAANQIPYNDMVVADPYANIAEDPRMGVYIGQSVGVGGMCADVVVYESGEVFAIIWVDGGGKLPGTPRTIVVDDPAGLRHHFEFSDGK